jgi:hypothetical protein
MTTRKKVVAVAATVGALLLVAAGVPSLLRSAGRGTPAVDYIREHGAPTALVARVTEVEGRLHGLRLDGVRLYAESQALAGALLVYPDSPDAIRHFRYLPNEEPTKGERSVHYSQRRMFRDERLVLVSVDTAGRVADVESKRYNWLTLFESPARIHSH